MSVLRPVVTGRDFDCGERGCEGAREAAVQQFLERPSRGARTFFMRSSPLLWLLSLLYQL
jgi:hypothetical protein